MTPAISPGAPPIAASAQSPDERAIALHKWSIARPWQTNAALVFLGIPLFLLTRQLVSEYDHFTIGFSGVSGWQAILYILSVVLILTQPVDRFTLPIILAVAIVCRLVTLYPDPYLSSDVYRYVWDGVVQHAHISPYRYAPGDPALTFLRVPNQDIFDNINRRDYAHTIYPPAAQALFYLITWISPTVTFMKTAMVLFEGITMYALIQLLAALNLRREQTLLYAWCPLLLWEIAGSGHLDSAAMAFIGLALLSRYRRQAFLTGLFLGIAILLKLYPLVLLPALLLTSDKPGTARPSLSLPKASNPKMWVLPSLRSLRNLDWKMPATVAAVVAAGYAAYSSVGILVFGFLGGYVKEEGLATGARYFLLELAQHIPGLHNLPTAVFYAFCILTFGLLTLWALHRATNQGATYLDSEMWASREPRPHSSPNLKTSGAPLIAGSSRRPGDTNVDASFLRPAFALAAALMFLFSPHYPWYIVWLIPFFTLMPNLPILTYLMTFFYLFTTELADPGPKMFLLNKILYSAVLLAVIVNMVLRRWPLHRIYFVQPSSASDPL